MKRASSASDPEVGGNAETPESLGVAVLTVSDTRTLETDRSGVAICELLEAAGQPGDGRGHSVRARQGVDPKHQHGVPAYGLGLGSVTSYTRGTRLLMPHTIS